MKPIILCILILLTAGPVTAEDYQPLATGNFWSYVAESGVEETRVVGEPVPIFQDNPYPLEYTIGDPDNQGLINFWTSESDGGVLLWGFERQTWGILYQPPIRMVDAPLYVGKTWTVTADLYSLPDTVFYQTMEFSFMVHEDPELTVPAGEFPTFGIGDQAPATLALLGGRYNLMGEITTNKDSFVNRWYSLGVGLVQEHLDEIYQLETWTDDPVGVEASSWGAVKALYRGGQ
jgi:hypothetical protein